MGERTARERNAADRTSNFEGTYLCDNAPFAEVGHQDVEAAKLQVTLEDGSHPLCFGSVDGNLAIFRVVAQGHHAADPKALALGGGDLVADPFRGDLTLELRK